MNDEHDNDDIDPETILVTLDQVSQTIDVLSNVVNRLQNYMHDYMDQQTEHGNQKELPLISKEYH